MLLVVIYLLPESIYSVYARSFTPRPVSVIGNSVIQLPLGNFAPIEVIEVVTRSSSGRPRTVINISFVIFCVTERVLLKVFITRRPASADRTTRRQFQAVFLVITNSQ